MRNRFILLLCLGLMIISCNKEDKSDYNPMTASSLNGSFYLLVKDVKGNDLLSDSEFEQQISVENPYNTNTKLSKESIEIKGSSTNVILINAPLPDIKSMNPAVNKETKKSVGKSVLYLKIKNNTIKLDCVFKYSSNIPNQSEDFIGGTALDLIKVESEGSAFETKNSKGKLVLTITMVDGKPLLK